VREEHGSEDQGEGGATVPAGHTGKPYPREETAEELFRACTDTRDSGAWDRFLRRFQALIMATIVRTARHYTTVYAELSDDLAQEVYLKLSAHGAEVLRRFEPRYPGAIFAYLRVIAANVVHDHFRSKWLNTTDTEASAESQPSPHELEWRLMLRDIDNVLRKQAAKRDRQIFWLYYRQGMSAKEIAAIAVFDLTVKGVESVLIRLNRLVRKTLGKSERVTVP
jgi:RNA polymerase sigma-70 factor (ECF subfamily)